MSAFSVQFDVKVTVTKTIKAKDLESALTAARELACLDPTTSKLIAIGRGIEHLWSDDVVVAGVSAA